MITRWRRTASATVLTLLLGTLVVLAYQYDGKPFTEVDLNDGGVWVTNRDMGLTARLNPQIKELDLGVDAASADFDIFQRATHLFLDDSSAERAVKPVDVARAAVQDPTTLPTGAVVAEGGGTFAIVDYVSGKAWVRTQAGLTGFSAKSEDPDAKGALSATVGTDGRAYVLGRDGTVTPFTLDESGVPVAGDEVRLGKDLGTDPEMVSLSVVEDTPVLFDRTSRELTRPGADPVTVEAADLSAVQLQQPSARGDDLYLATAEGLFRTSIEGGALDEVSRGSVSGRPAAPVVLDSTGCVYAAWADPGSTNNYLRDCPDDSFDDTSPINGIQAGAALQFRVNRDVIVLNDVVTGDTWLVEEPGKAKVDNWPSVDPQNENRSKLKETTEEVPEQENRPPEPQDDDLGARPGRSTVLPVVALNDHDPDGDIISISKTQYVSGPELEVKIVGGGTQLQAAVPADAEGTAVFRYYVTDGKVNDERWAEVRLRIRASGQHVKPKLMPDRKPRLVVTRGATADYYLLADFYDEDGDDLTLRDVSSRDGEVEFRPDGTISFSDTSTGGGPRTAKVAYTVEDAFDTYSGELEVRVVGDSAPPELVADLASGVAGTHVVVQPLTNDRNPEGKDLTLKSVKVVGDDSGTQISEDLESGTFTFTSTKAKSYYLQYAAYNSSATKTSFIRLDIESPPKDNRPPVAVRDKAVITPGGTAQVDLLLNDLDPDGDVLVVKRVSRPSVPGVKVSIVDKRLAVVSSATDIVGSQATVDYVVSDGRSSTTGSLVITQRRASQANRQPVANKDQVTVRAGSVTTIPVLANDSDPDGAKPRLFQSDLNNEQKLAVWVAGDTLRLRAPEKPGTYSVFYGVRDTDGLKATAEVSIYVVADSAKNNHPPVPQPIIDRVIGGRPKVISVDLVGADPDGDSVAFRSILTAPALGRVLDTGVDWIRYEAFEGKVGTDFFQILVQDKYGATGVAEVRVGVVAEEEENQPPVALDDNVLVQPNRTISFNVLGNDVDPDDDPLRIAELNSTTKAEHENGFIEVPVGDAPDSGAAATNIGYTIEDAAGARDNAVLKVRASRDAPFYAPIANDDVAELGDIIGRDPGEKVEVPVLDNDLDFDGAKADLRVTSCDAGSKGECEVTKGDTTIEVELQAQDQVVLYQLDDADDESTGTFGVIFVTGTENVPPQLTTDEDKVPVEATAGQPVTFDLQDLVVTRAGREPMIVPDTLPTAVNGAVNPVKGAPTSLAFTPNKGHVGPASVTVSVADGPTAADDALTSLLTIPIDVQPSENVAPQMRDAAVDVVVDGDPAEVDLAGLTTDANEDDLGAMTYSVSSADSGLTADVPTGESIVRIKAGGGTKDGDTLRVRVVADDGHGGTAQGVITARVVGSDRPLTQVPPITVTAAKDEAKSIDLSDYAVNPYPGEPLEAKDPKIEGTGTGKLSDLRADGSTVSFRTGSSGTSTIRVIVADASGDRAREVPARITVTVKDVPDAPERPTLSSVEASSAVLSWREPETNGAAIEQYEVRGSHGFQQACVNTTCRLADLTPGETYTFTVRAKNSEGWGKESPASADITPNKAPDLMTPPTIVVEPKPTGSRMDRQLTVRWTPPNNEGSEITSYEIKEAGSGRTWQASGGETSKVIAGLSNGTSYAFEIRAINEVEPRREFSGASKPATPFGLPMRSGVAPRLTASEADSYTQQPWVSIEWPRWTESQSNGNAITGYVIKCSGCARSTYTAPASATSKLFDASAGIRKGKTVTFTVAAVNDAGTSDPSPSVSGRPWTKAGPVRNLVEVGRSPADRTARVGWDAPADDGGLPIHHYVVETNSGSRTTVGAAPGGGGASITFPDNGRHSIQVWAVTYNGDRAVEGQASGLGEIDTWGQPYPPGDTSATSSDPYQVEVTLQAGGENGMPVTGVQYSENNGGSWTDARSGDRFRSDVPEGGSSKSILVRTVSAADGDRKYSAATRLTATSRAKNLTIAFDCLSLDSTCRIRVRGDGFIREDRNAAGSVSGLSGNDNCGSLDQTVNGAFDYYLGGNRCRFSGNGSATVTTSGVTQTTGR